ncbi:glutaminyl-peptide cyclotransferase, putative [Plasmodium gallinaceum]|uniref:Glutaminyl-peptide cyclotransferase, putative n=1 Tax=Plasmodium gallinaceum TaxID=5849 RepID=A0A1J1GQG9_PLAGA|nr:glutaminyl-peptide cyclotransferase, putative [Plasmodium gallinaceum]CRG94664.1 glutaminyl-peptide cyclotransferase, putative [Plasmodium gallinaceum]
MCLCRLVRKFVSLIILMVMLFLVAGILFTYYIIKNIKTSDIFSYVINTHTYEVLNKYKHIHDPSVGKEIKIDPKIETSSEKVHPFTQGFFFSDKNRLIESVGLYKSSFLREFDLVSGNTIRYTNFGPQYFGEGSAFIIEPSTYKKLILNLTYKEKTIFVFDYESLELYHTFTFDLDGYGLTSNVDTLQSVDALRKDNFVLNQKLWATTGDEYLYELQIPDDFKNSEKIYVSKKTKITCGGFIIDRTNELEYYAYSKTIFANIFLTNLIVEINSETGKCVKLINLDGLIKKCDNYEHIDENIDDVLNGIAISPQSKNEETPVLFVTGKNWSNIFEITIKRKIDELAHKVLLRGKFKLNLQ